MTGIASWRSLTWRRSGDMFVVDTNLIQVGEINASQSRFGGNWGVGGLDTLATSASGRISGGSGRLAMTLSTSTWTVVC